MLTKVTPMHSSEIWAFLIKQLLAEEIWNRQKEEMLQIQKEINVTIKPFGRNFLGTVED